MAGSGEVITWRELADRSRRLARLLHHYGLRPGDHLALHMENHARYLEVVWAALRSGLYLTAIDRRLGVEEAAYIVDNCDARVLIASNALAIVAGELPDRVPAVEHFLMVDGRVPGFGSYEASIAGQPPQPLADEPLGDIMLYSSGSTGQPKGITRPLSGRKVSDGHPVTAEFWGTPAQVDESSVLLVTSPLHHSAPISFCFWTQTLGGSVVVQEHFDALQVLELIERYRVTHAVLVPTMFVRLLRWSDAERARFDLSSLRVAVHGAAPCPIEIKQRMIEWWGPVIEEYYGGTEDNGLTYIRSDEWLAHAGSVGRAAFGSVHVVDDDGNELPPGEVGGVYFSGLPFEYHKEPEKTRAAHLDDGKSTLGDIGYLDQDGYLYLVDRKDYMIISGGVNIYPQEVEDRLVVHPKVADAAVFGVPHPELGEAVKAVVEPAAPVVAGPDLEAELIAYCREHLAGFKCPKSVDFDTSLPREPTGKLYKRKLKARYW